MESWSTHGEGTGGFYSCNVYDEAKTAAKLEKLRIEQTKALGSDKQRFEFYSSRFNNHHSNSNFVTLSEHRLEKLINTLSKKDAAIAEEFRYMIDAAQVVERSHQQLAWSHCFKYFMNEVKWSHLLNVYKDSINDQYAIC